MLIEMLEEGIRLVKRKRSGKTIFFRNQRKTHIDARMMADLAKAVYEYGCFETVGVPFCMTVEAEEMGALVDIACGRSTTSARGGFMVKYNPE